MGGYIINLFKRLSDFLKLNQLKEKLYRMDEKELKDDEVIDLNRTKPQNPFGIITLFLGVASFTFGVTYIIIPIIAIIFCILTFGTFDKKTEDNPWTFYLGFCLTLIGLIINLSGSPIKITI